MPGIPQATRNKLWSLPTYAKAQHLIGLFGLGRTCGNIAATYP